MANKPDTFARRLRDLREGAGLSVYALARRSGVTRQYLAELERGEKEPSLEIARKLAEAFSRQLDCWQ